VSTAQQQPPQAEKPKLPQVVVTFPAAVLGARIGDSVVFYQHGDRDADGTPAVVKACELNGMLALCVLKGAYCETKKVRHVDDPYFKDNPAARARDGVWDYVNGDLPPLKADFPQELDAVALEIMRHWNNNVRVPTIVQRIRSQVTIGGVVVEDPLAVVQVTLGQFARGYRDRK
jgi:hypothetical protein